MSTRWRTRFFRFLRHESLARLGLDYVDLYLIHAPFDREQRLAQWCGLEALKEQRQARSIGVSNFNVGHLAELAAAGLPRPQANQIELHPWSQKPELVRYLNERGIVPIASSSLVPLSTWRSAPGHDSAKTDAMQADSNRADSPFKALDQKYGVSDAQVLLRWGIQNGYPVLPKSTSPTVSARTRTSSRSLWTMRTWRRSSNWIAATVWHGRWRPDQSGPAAHGYAASTSRGGQLWLRG